MMPHMALRVRPATPEDRAGGLLYESARPYYDVYAGGERRARALLAAVYPRTGHAASYEVCHVAELDGRLAGVMAAFPVSDADRYATSFVRLTLPRIPPWRWPRLLHHLSAAGTVSPAPPDGWLYVDALAVEASARRRGVASALLAAAAEDAAGRGMPGLALDTGLANAPARALYEHNGFELRDERRAPSERVARAVGGPGFAGYVRPA